MKPKLNLLSGLRSTSEPHVGNYLGAIKQFIELQDQYNCFFMVANLHSLTTPFVPKELRENTVNVVADYVALGLDPARCTLFVQSDVPEHTELSWILSCITPLGELYRMTQFKDKSADEKRDSVNAGLLTYPVLMAADILLYGAEVVPVGEDQVQHVELARIIARKFNSKLGKTFPEPKALLSKSLRIKSLVHPEKKMSKTNDEPLNLTDTPEQTMKKFRKAVTATDPKGASLGVDNLFVLLREFGTKEQIEYFENERAFGGLKFSELKETLAQQVSDHFAPFREKRAELLANKSLVAEILGDGAHAARKVAGETLARVKDLTGLL